MITRDRDLVRLDAQHAEYAAVGKMLEARATLYAVLDSFADSSKPFDAELYATIRALEGAYHAECDIVAQRHAEYLSAEADWLRHV
jgi:hypothetical protein